ncbi:MAG: hypothetical protein Q9183_006356, partial [Haloplaca sp. 2 TL-2023]
DLASIQQFLCNQGQDGLILSHREKEPTYDEAEELFRTARTELRRETYLKMRHAHASLVPRYLFLVGFYENFALKEAHQDIFFAADAHLQSPENFLAKWDWETPDIEDPTLKYMHVREYCRKLKLKGESDDGDGGEGANIKMAMSYLVDGDLDGEHDEDMDDAEDGVTLENAPQLTNDDAMDEEGPDSP